MAQVNGTPNPDTIGVGTASVGVEPVTGATSENDTITGLAGADSLAGGAGSDDFKFDPSNPLEGHDVIQDFTLPSGTDSSKLDYVAFQSAQVLPADPGLPGADGNAASLSLDDFEASPNWNLSSSAAGSLLIEHPGGSIELAGIPSNAFTSFNGLAPSLKVDDKIWSGPINLTPVPPPAGLTPPSPPPDVAGTTPNPTGAGTTPNPTGAGTTPNPTGAGTTPPAWLKLDNNADGIPDYLNLLDNDPDIDGLGPEDVENFSGSKDLIKQIVEYAKSHDIPNEDSFTKLNQLVNEGKNVRILGPEDTPPSTEGTPTEGTPTEGTPTGGTPTEGTPTGGTPTGGTPTGGTPTGGTPTEGTPTGGTPTGGTPTGGTPTGGTPTGGTPTGGTPTEGTPTGGTPTEGTPTEEALLAEPLHDGSLVSFEPQVFDMLIA